MADTAGTALHTKTFPGETEQYRQARDQLLTAEMDLRAREEVVAAQRRELPLGGEVATDYIFERWDEQAHATREVRFSELFEDGQDTLFLYSFMFIPGAKQLPLEVGCPSCTSIIDAVDGQVPHLSQRISIAVEAKAPIERFQAHARTRGWRHAPLLSSANNTYRRDYHAELADGEQLPLATVFVKRDGRIHHFWSSELFFVPPDPGQHPRHVDFIWPLWAVLDRTPAGRDPVWQPALRYPQARRV
jgi:predicted dithiol-disulfide oxidoreductase (DUF899 family)